MKFFLAVDKQRKMCYTKEEIRTKKDGGACRQAERKFLHFDPEVVSPKT